MASGPRPRFGDHVHLCGVAVLTLLGLVPLLVWIAFAVVLRPLIRSRLRKRLERSARPPDEPPVPDPEAWDGRTVFVVVGEASGDNLAARVVTSLRALCPGVRVRGYAGPATEAAGATLDRNLVEHSVLGVTAVLRSLGFWWRLSAETLARFREDPPDVLLTVDFPGLNGRLARWARQRGIRTVHLVAPGIWAYAPWRVFRWRRALDSLLTTFPFEAVLLEGSGIPCTFVGHPLFEAPLPPPRTGTTWPGDGPCTVELLPGSRRQEIRAQTAVVLDAARHIEERVPGARFVVRLAAADAVPHYEAVLAAAPSRPRSEVVVQVGGETADAAAPLLGAVASSGTVSAELGAALVPMSVFYRLSWWGRFGAFVGLISPWIALANLLAGEVVAPERLQVGRGGRRVAEGFLAVAGTRERWLDTRSRLEHLVRERVAAEGVSERAARAVLYRPQLAAVGESGTSSSPAGGPS